MHASYQEAKYFEPLAVGEGHVQLRCGLGAGVVRRREVLVRRVPVVGAGGNLPSEGRRRERESGCAQEQRARF